MEKTKKQLVPKLRFKEFDSTWEKKKVADVSVFFDGRRKPIKSEDRAKMKGVYPYYGASGIIDYVNEYIFDEDIILLGEDGENIISRNLPLAFRVSGKCWINNHAHVIRNNKGTDIDFLTLVLELTNYVIYNTGTAQPKLNQEVCKNIPLTFPTLSEQQKIASFLSSVDEKIQQLTRKKEMLEQYKKGVMQQLFKPSELGLEGLEDNRMADAKNPKIRSSYKSQFRQLRFRDENGKEYPKWETKKLEDICSFYSGGTPESTNRKFYSGTIPFIGSGNIYDSEVFSFISEDALNSSSAKLVEEGDLLFALYGANSGEVAISKINGAINQAVLCIRTNENTKYLFYILFLNQGRIVSKYLQGGQGNLSGNIVKKLKYKLPSLDEQQKIAAYLSVIDTKIENVSNQITQTQTFKKGLLQQMFV